MTHNEYIHTHVTIVDDEKEQRGRNLNGKPFINDSYFCLVQNDLGYMLTAQWLFGVPLRGQKKIRSAEEKHSDPSINPK